VIVPLAPGRQGVPRRIARAVDTLEVCFWLAFFVPWVAYCFARGEIATRRRQWKAWREARRAAAAMASRGYTNRSEL
jgi:hypothetical protein